MTGGKLWSKTLVRRRESRFTKQAMRKYLFIAANEWANWGGSELLWSQTAEKLARRGLEVRVSVPTFGRPIKEVEPLRSAGCHIVYRKVNTILHRIRQRIFLLPEYAHTHVRSAGKGVDLVVVSQGSNIDGLPWMEAARSAGCKYAVIAEGAHEVSWVDDDTAERLALAYEKAARAYFVSQANLNLTRRQFAASLRSAKVIRNPFNVKYDAHPVWPACSPEELSLACVGRLDVGTKGRTCC